MGLLLVQAVLGGVTVLLLLPDAISSSHLALAFLFLALATVLATVTSPTWGEGPGFPQAGLVGLRRGAVAAALFTFAQSVVGAAVRHTDAGMACPDVPLCLGEWIPPLSYPLVALHFTHRILGLAVLGIVLWVGHIAFWRGTLPLVRRLGLAVAVVALAQVLLGFFSVFFRLAVVPVSLHTLLAATLLALLVVLATRTWAPVPGDGSTARNLGQGASPAVPGGATENERGDPE
jgi:heme A synthase